MNNTAHPFRWYDLEQDLNCQCKIEQLWRVRAVFELVDSSFRHAEIGFANRLLSDRAKETAMVL